jgi:hypothetical protein
MKIRDPRIDITARLETVERTLRNGLPQNLIGLCQDGFKGPISHLTFI